jgi:Bacterial Ig-like domain (group 3)
MRQKLIIGVVLVAALIMVQAPSAGATGTLDQQQTDTSGGAILIDSQPPNPPANLGRTGGAQTFTAGLSGGLDQVDLFLYKETGTTLPLNVEIRTVDGSGAPTTTVLESAIVPFSSVPAAPGAFVPVTFSVPHTVAAGTQYAIVAYTAEPPPRGYGWFYSTADPYPGGTAWLSTSTTPPPTTWTQVGQADFAFKTYVTPPAKHQTSTSVSCSPQPVVAGQPTTCTATVTDTATSGQTPPTGTVGFTSNGPGTFGTAGSCTLATASSSSASCSVTYTPGSTPANPVRTDTITATYTGDPTHTGSSNTTDVSVVSPTALASGSFVIGDQNASVGNRVTFWGAQWWKLNSLSGGPAPAAFKGFASHVPNNPPRCNDHWTTQPGASSNPPATVPQYMAVIASSSITQSGSTIAGDTTDVVVVKTNAGYGPNPGNAGTGTVVAAEVCGS